MRKISTRNSLLTHFLPRRVRCRESHVQYSLNPARCQRTTVSGWTRINACFHSGQSRRKITQNNLSGAANLGLGVLPFQDAELLPQRQILHEQVTARENRSNEQDEQAPQHTRHVPILDGIKPRQTHFSSA